MTQGTVTSETQTNEHSEASRIVASSAGVRPIGGLHAPRWFGLWRNVLFAQDREASTTAAVKLRAKNQNIRLRRNIAYWSIAFVVLQLVASNVFFGYYLYQNVSNIEVPIMVSWLSSSVIEIIAILGIVASSLFPRRDKPPKSEAQQPEPAG